jgi:GR25 family glycosyltransferase involved in LPS biosynthesis
VYQPSERPEDKKFIAECLAWFETHQIPLHVETNSLMVDFNIMKQVKILVCGMSTLAWAAAYLSKYLEKCYMPNFNFYKTNRPMCYFHKPIANTILYQVNSTPSVLGQVKTRLMTLPNYPARLGKLDDLIQNLAIIGLEPTIYHGVHGKDIDIHEAACQQTHIKHITWENTTYFYDMRVRINGQHMSRGEFGCAWSHLNLLRQLVADTDPLTNYYLVLEDDVELVKPLSDLYELIEHLPPDTDLCHLAKSDWYPFVLTNQVNTYFYECEKKYFNKTTAYIVSKKGAQKILDYTKNSINVPIDDLFNMIFRLTPDFRFYVPAAFYFKEQDNVVSTIKDIDHS